MKATRWRKILSLSLSEVWFVMQAALMVVTFDLALRLFSPKTCLALFERNAGTRQRQKPVNAQRMAWLVDVADRYAPGRSSCLRRAAALAWMFRRSGVPTTLRIGVAREGDNLTAHSWLESGDGQVFGLSDADQYVPLSNPALTEAIKVGSER